MTQQDDDEPDIQFIANKIQRYLSDKQNAADTLQGLVQWWLIRQSVEEKIKVKRAVEQLVQVGSIKVRRLSDGTEVYMANSKDSFE